MAEGKFISYLRVSTDRQGRSGLGLEAQRQAVAAYLNGGSWELLAEHVEVESGKRRSRPVLAEALAACKKHKATLVIARLDRLSRNLHFTSGLMESGVEFVACDMPTANRLTVQIMSAIAEEEGRRISERTRAALQAAKARGKALGTHGRIQGQQNREGALQHVRRIAPVVQELRVSARTVRELTTALNQAAVPTPAGGRWHLASVHRLLQRLDHVV